MSNEQEASREQLENALAYQVGARKLLELVAIRVTQAAGKPGMKELLLPATDDLQNIMKKLDLAQKELSLVWSQQNKGGITEQSH